MGSAKSSYNYLSAQGYISGANSALVRNGQSCLSWYGGGNMPPGGGNNSQAVKDMNAWAAAGALDN
jgi:hypothetical protein